MMIFRIPVIASNVEGNKEIIIHNKTGLLSKTSVKSLRLSIQKFYKLSLKQKEELDQANKQPHYKIKNTCFSTITINRNFRTALHKDAGDFSEGFGNLTVI